MNKIRLMLMGILSLATVAYATPIDANTQGQVKYEDVTTGVEIIFSPNSPKWDKIVASGESEFLFGDRKDIRQATSKAIMRAKANIAKFLKERLNTSETLEGITKTISSATLASKGKAVGADRKTAETSIEQISDSANAILKGVLVLEQKVNKKEKYVSVKVGMSRKTMRTADNMSNAINKDLSKKDKSTVIIIQESNDGKTVTRRSKNYDNF